MSIFNLVVERRKTRSFKWDMMEQIYSIDDASDILPMWVADMDFTAPKEVIEAIEKRLQQQVLGYSFVDEGCKKAIASWHETRQGWTIETETILFHQGVVPAIATIIETFTEVGDKVAMMSPVYPPFFNVPTNQKREVLFAELDEHDGIYTINFERIEQTFKDGAKILILCNPHNPAGIVWSRSDLEKIVTLAINYNVILLSDEIHADLVLEGNKHIPLFNVQNADKAKIIATIAPTKTFNLAGIQAAMMVVPSPELRAQLEQNLLAHGQMGLNVFASVAVQAAYTFGADWLDELLHYLSMNMDYVVQELTALEGIKVRKPGGTYLMWIDYRETGLSEEEMMQRLLHKGKLALEPGTKYGESGRGFLRMNVACSFETVKDGVERFKKALQ